MDEWAAEYALIANVGVGRTRRSYLAERESGIPRPTLAAHDDCDGGDGYRHMKKRYGNRQNMIDRRAGGNSSRGR